MTPVPPDGENPYRRLIALHPGKDFGPPSPPTSLPAINRTVAAWDEGFAAGRAAASPDPPTRTVHKCPSCDRYFDSPSVCSDGTHTVERQERVPSGVWPDQSATHGVLLDQIRELHQENERLRAASPDERLREALRDLAEAARPYVERAAPDEKLWDEQDYRNFLRLSSALAAAVDPELVLVARHRLPAALAASPDERLREAGCAAMVDEFHRAFDYKPWTDDPTLRVALHKEEHRELIEALLGGDRAAIARELADVVYVAYGSAWSLGIDLDVAFAEVHRANMSKLGEDGKPLLREDGKVLKGPNFTPPDMTAALAAADREAPDEGWPDPPDHMATGRAMAEHLAPETENNRGD